METQGQLFGNGAPLKKNLHSLIEPFTQGNTDTPDFFEEDDVKLSVGGGGSKDGTVGSKDGLKDLLRTDSWTVQGKELSKDRPK